MDKIYPVQLTTFFKLYSLLIFIFLLSDPLHLSPNYIFTLGAVLLAEKYSFQYKLFVKALNIKIIKI